jgi:hypothetical protein
MLGQLLFWALEVWFTSWLGNKVEANGDFGFRVGDRFEKLAHDTPIVQGRVTEVVKLRDDRILTIAWDDGTRTIGRPEDVLRSARHIHPLAPRLDRSPRP